MNMGIERKMKVLDCPRSLGNHFIHSQLSSPLSRGATWLRNDGQPVHSGCQRRPGSDPEPSKLIQHLMYTEDPSWASLAVAGACCSRHAELPLRWPADHGWLTPTFSSSHSRKAQRGWCTLLVGHATTALHGNQNLSLNIYLIFIYMHIPWSVLPHSSLSPRLFLQLHVAFFNFFFLISPWDFHNSHPLQNSGHPNPTLFSFTSTSFEDYFRLWPLWISLPRAEFSLRKISSSRSS